MSLAATRWSTRALHRRPYWPSVPGADADDPRFFRRASLSAGVVPASGLDGDRGVRYLHAFDAHFPALADLGWADLARNATDDAAALALVRDLLEAAAYLHARGLPHLSLNDEYVRVGAVGVGAVGRKASEQAEAARLVPRLCVRLAWRRSARRG